jgi:hypothetical protein
MLDSFRLDQIRANVHLPVRGPLHNGFVPNDHIPFPVYPLLVIGGLLEK